MVAPRRSAAGYADLLTLPDNVVGELVAGERVRAVPFDAIELDLAVLWQR